MTNRLSWRRLMLACFVALTPVVVPAFVSPAIAQSESVSDIRVDLGPIIIRIPRIETSGANMSATDIKGLFNPAVTEPLSRRLGRLNATAIVIPEMTVEQAVGPTKTSTVYRDVRINGIKEGRASEIVISSATFRNEGKGPDNAEGTMARTTMTNADLALMAKVYGEVAGPDDKDYKVIYSSLVSDGITMKMDKAVEVAIARMSGKEARARPVATPLITTMRQLGAIDPNAKPNSAENAKNALNLFDMLEAFSIGDAEATGISIRDPNAKDGPIVANIARMGFRLNEASGGEARLEGFSVDSKDARIRIGTIAFTDFSFKPTLAGLRTMLANPATKPDDFDARSFVPTLGTISLASIDIDVPESAAKGREANTANRMKIRLRNAEVKAANQLNAIPTSLRIAVDGLAFDIPANSKEAGLKELVELGYKAVDVSWAFDAVWNEKSSEIAIQNLSFGGIDMGRIEAKATLGNATKDLFSSDVTMQQIAALGTTAKALTINVENKGLVERILRQQARNSKKTPDELRREYGSMAALVIPAMLGPSAASKQIGNAVAQFIARPNRLTLSATTKDPAGLGVADVASMGAPAAVLEQLEITAKAE